MLAPSEGRRRQEGAASRRAEAGAIGNALGAGSTTSTMGVAMNAWRERAGMPAHRAWPETWAEGSASTLRAVGLARATLRQFTVGLAAVRMRCVLFGHDGTASHASSAGCSCAAMNVAAAPLAGRLRRMRLVSTPRLLDRSVRSGKGRLVSPRTATAAHTPLTA